MLDFDVIREFDGVRPNVGSAELIAKLNELIDAVNAIQQFINLEHPTQPPFPPFILPAMDEIKARLNTIR